MNNSGNPCPICSHENEPAAPVCGHCGAWLEENPTRIVTIPENMGGKSQAPAERAESLIDVSLIPEDGVGIYVVGQFKPYFVHIYRELILGRAAEATLESVLDLSELDAANLGVSRRHAMIRRTDSGFEVLDLASRNGTWLNAERLIPNRPHPLPSGSQLRIGQMRLLVMYQPVSGDKKKRQIG